ncbi:hypothetical protein PHLH7_08390 [Pseudomonas sp. Ost2]|uniref:hypothetical protein n=1 Tax=Pseudomonas sp. Ost2 TaxID=2678260 RepID=UPI001BB42F8F|nr:hypothetical protein [Pseudomonas sp. Ost2]BBP74735.1 hypothetical protein PHLH7_08390 [Pseudomonas sp. Ost2]
MLQQTDEQSLSEACKSACGDYLKYLKSILEPALKQLEDDSTGRALTLHQVIGANLCAAHAVDYIHAIRAADGVKEKRCQLVSAFDSEFAIGGARIQGGKMRLVDAVNNAMKHIRIDPKRYADLVQKYGQVSFECLVAFDGKVLCLLDGFRFDFVRVALLPTLRALRGWQFEDEVDVLEFARGGLELINNGASYCAGDDDPIDALIEACNPACVNCDEYEDDCQCAEYVFDGKTGAFEGRFASTDELDTLLCAVSGAYRRDRL